MLIELKNDEFKHEDLGQLNAYVGYYKKNEMTEGDNLLVGILLCTDKGSQMVECALSGMDNQLFVSTYMLHLPDKKKLKEFILRNGDIVLCLMILLWRITGWDFYLRQGWTWQQRIGLKNEGYFSSLDCTRAPKGRMPASQRKKAVPRHFIIFIEKFSRNMKQERQNQICFSKIIKCVFNEFERRTEL